MACVLASLLPSCSRRSPSATSSAAQLLRISQRNEPADLDPATASLPDEFFIIRALGEGLLAPNSAGGAPIPAAAETYDVSADRLTYAFHLRADGKWSDGDPVTSDDFVASFRRVLDPATAAPKAHLFFAVKNARAFATGKLTDFAAVGFQAPDPHTLVVTLAEPTLNFPLYVASGPWIPVNPRVVAKFGRAWTQPANYVGNGPFRLSEWRPQQRIAVVKNDGYRDAAHVRLSGIQFIRFDNQDSEERAYRAGQVDVTMSVPQTKIEVYARERPQELHRAALAETRFISFNVTRPPLTDGRVRRALALAIDRRKLVTYVLRGGQQPALRFLSPALLGAAPEQSGPDTAAAAKLEFDPAAARRLLAEAGFAGGRNFPRLELSGWDRNPILEAIQQMWRQELGIDVNLAIREAKVHLATLNAGNYDLAFVTNLLDVRDPVAVLTDFTTAAPNNFPHWHSAEFDRAVMAASSAPNARSASEDLATAEAILLKELPIAPVYFNTQNWLMSPRVRDWQQDALWGRRYNDAYLGPDADGR